MYFIIFISPPYLKTAPRGLFTIGKATCCSVATKIFEVDKDSAAKLFNYHELCAFERLPLWCFECTALP